MSNYTTQNDLLMKKLLDFYRDENHLNKMLGIINGKSLTLNANSYISSLKDKDVLHELLYKIFPG